MKKLFYIALAGLLVFEVLNVYFVMPMPGSQRMDSIAIAYFLYHWRWIFRIILFSVLIYGYLKANWKRRWLPLIPVVMIGFVLYFVNFKMSADHMFLQPGTLTFSGGANNKVDMQRLVIGVVINNEAKAYPIQFLGYHHIVQDTVGGKPVLISYCTVCRTGRAFDPVINGSVETFRLVGMDHFNAMFEDATTKSWWRQATGEAVAGSMKGKRLAEIYCSQTSLAEWMKLHPESVVMQEDPSSREFYSKNYDYESGKSRSKLTGTDTLSWKDKSWVVGVKIADSVKAYDWNLLKSKRIIMDELAGRHIILVLSADNSSFFAFEANAENAEAVLRNDTILYGGHQYSIDGKGIDTAYALKKLPAYQEFWHSWRTFNPASKSYN